MAALWRDTVVVPVLNLLGTASAALPFSLAERIVPAIALLLPLLRRRRAARIMLCACLVPVLLWCSLFFCTGAAPAAPDANRLHTMCVSLIDRLNGEPLDFSDPIPNDPRVKTAGFPFWMRLLNVSGIFVPLTGEILISPDAAPAALPFTVVHETMHMRGVADEGGANIAAWHACHASGGDAAASADLWALGYGLRMLKRTDPSLCAAASTQMNFRLRRAMRFFDVDAAESDYENLAAHLAANPAYWYNDTNSYTGT